MSPAVLMDTGPIIAYLRRRDAFHAWAVEQFERLDPPFIVCEPVLTEACFLIARIRQPATRVLDLVARGVLRLDFQIEDELAPIRALMERYAEVPMSLADACLVRLAETTGLPICTLDGDFAIYRARRRQALTLVAPKGPGSLHEP